VDADQKSGLFAVLVVIIIIIINIIWQKTCPMK
jgi:hypothetical protein